MEAHKRFHHGKVVSSWKRLYNIVLQIQTKDAFKHAMTAVIHADRYTVK